MPVRPQQPVMQAAAPDPGREGRPLLLCLVPAGWPSPAEDYVEGSLDLHRYAVANDLATYFMHASGDSMIGAGIHDGDLLVVDRSVEPYPGAVVIAAVEGELTVKRYAVRGGRHFLQPENERYRPLEVTGRDDVCIRGVVTHVLHRLIRGKPLGSR